ncbi:hypothetical protein [Sporomusa sphaeroides]|uniref:Uncharacterized protein n=1 Tax=Sporomusa sphaeroides DSM 2875 TaxID=1337886 RepID=A0ABM9VZS4_9FIRM|nr:hypothetical protein [Sporomusa sphaeroides]OLS56313.1 hypothetical protein SPSPH_27060 [Sporomusa sphaeroides DSM 2875]CVK18408.1 hypothetical protein SSPH_01046 [Sporomusa sphaeroides DSM 2875]
MSLIDKFAALKFGKEPVVPTVEPEISEDWSRFLCQFESVAPELHQFLYSLAKEGVALEHNESSARGIVLYGSKYECLPAITIELNPERFLEDGRLLL